MELTHKILNSMTSGIFCVDLESRIFFVNRFMQNTIGRSDREVMGRLAYEVLGFPSRKSCPIAEAISSGKPIIRREAFIRRKDGTEILAGMTINPLKDQHDHVIGAVGLVADLTPRRSVEEEKKVMQNLAMIGEMAARMAHEIKNPLTSIYSGLQLLKMQLDMGDRDRERIDLILNETRRLNDIVRNLVVFSKAPVLNLAMGNILDPIESALSLLEPQIEAKDIRCTRGYEKGIKKCLMDGYQMRQVFSNIFLNAIEAMDQGGDLGINVRRKKIHDRDILDIEITDTGCGMSPDQLKKIFTPFFSTRRKGTGLGLVTAKRIVEEHGGMIAALSEPGEGSSFILRFFAGERRKCWEIKGCPMKDHCDVFNQNAGLRCWSLRADSNEAVGFNLDECSSCEAYKENSLYYYMGSKGFLTKA